MPLPVKDRFTDATEVVCFYCSRPFFMNEESRKRADRELRRYRCKPCIGVERKSRKPRGSTCGLCGDSGHNRRGCPRREGRDENRERAFECFLCLDLAHRRDKEFGCPECGKPYSDNPIPLEYVLSLPRESRSPWL